MKRHVTIPEGDAARNLLGAGDAVLRSVREAFGVTVSARGERIVIDGPPPGVERAQACLEDLAGRAERGHRMHAGEIDNVMGRHMGPGEGGIGVHVGGPITVSPHRRVEPKGPGQRAYVDAMSDYDVVFGIGPAGTGKTYLATAVAAAMLAGGQVGRIVLVRPAVEAGEKLGFLPGDLAEKVNPYLRPIYDALSDLMPYSQVNRYLEKGIIEVAPLAFMRGRTLNNAFVILDEAQNTTMAQMKMFLTRLGNRSKAVVTGDVTQSDLTPETESGLAHAERILTGLDALKFIYLDAQDIVRHPLVIKILDRYDRHPTGKAGTADKA